MEKNFDMDDMDFLPDGVIEDIEFVAGVDEVGRGPLAGPVCAAAVILPKGFKHELIKDSKKLSIKDRNRAANIIRRNAIALDVNFVNSGIIDKINILRATFYAMKLSLDGLGIKPKHILVDGNQFFNYNNIPYSAIVKGDSKHYSIAAASIIAKVTRDEYMAKLHIIFPNYGWKNNVGYGTKQHIEAIKTHGLTIHHRKSFCKKYI